MPQQASPVSPWAGQPMGWPYYGPYVLGHATSARETNIGSGLDLRKIHSGVPVEH